MYLEVTYSQTFETFVRCHIHAFETLGGIAGELWYDNLATVVAEHDGNLVRFHPRFLALCPRVRLFPTSVSRGGRLGEGSGFILHLVRYFRRKLRIAAPIAESLTRMSSRQWSSGGFE
jgi:hypothetical protein